MTIGATFKNAVPFIWFLLYLTSLQPFLLCFASN